MSGLTFATGGEEAPSEGPFDQLMKKPLWTIEDLALWLTRSVDGVRKMRTLGHLPRARRVGRRLYWLRDEILAWIDASGDDDDFTPRSYRP